MTSPTIWNSNHPLTRLGRLSAWGGLLILVVLLATLVDRAPTGGGRVDVAPPTLPPGLGRTMPPTVLWGAYVGSELTDMEEFEQQVGRNTDMEMVFAHFGNDPDFPLQYSPTIRDRQKTMVLFWEALNYDRDPMHQPEYSFDAVLRGDFDAYFRRFSLDAKAYGGPVVLVPYSEMNGNWFPWGGTVGGNTPEKYITAYRHLHSFFRDVPNVKFGWVVNARDVPNVERNHFENFYPGDTYVDYVGVDGFDVGGDEAQSFDQLFGDALTRLRTFKKPIWIFSMGTASNPYKPLWMTEALTVELYRHPEVKGWLWFNTNKEHDWRVDENSATLEAFQSALGVQIVSSTQSEE